jgi:hypothetical protein
MKIYPSDNMQAVNSVARKRKQIVVPPFNLIGPNQATVSDKWYPNTNSEVVGAFVTTKTTGIIDAGFAILKNNIFEQNVVVASVTLSPTDTKAIFTLANPLGGLTFSKYDWITTASFLASGHSGIVIQLFMEEIN